MRAVISSLPVFSKRTPRLFFSLALTTLILGAGPTTTTLSPLVSATFGTSVTLTATVSPAGATGKVTFYDFATVLGVAQLTPGGTATLPTIFLSTGVRFLTARYSGDIGNAGSVSPGVFPVVSSTAANYLVGPTTSSVGALPFGIAALDYNNDNFADLVTANNNSNTVTLLRGNGTASFALVGHYGAGTHPTAVAVGDFNGDQFADLAVTNDIAGTVSILLGTGAGFPSAVPYMVGVTPRAVAVGDVNGDGKADLVVANFGSNNISVLLGNGDGTFQPQVNYPVGLLPRSVVVRDFNGDGAPDLAVANSDSHDVSVLLNKNDGSGTFFPNVNYGIGLPTRPTSIAVADFNSNGAADLAVTDSVTSNVTILLGAGDGTFGPPATYPLDGPGFSVAVGDVDGDTITDLVVAITQSGAVDVLRGNGDGTFKPRVRFPAGINPSAVVVADFKADGRVDAAFSDLLAGQAGLLVGASLTINKTQGDGQSAAVNSTFALPLVATVTDQSSAVVPGVSVTFTAPGAGASAKFAGNLSTTVVTGGGGQASSGVVTANAIVGAYPVPATAGYGASANFSLNNVGVPSIVVQAGSPQSVPIGSTFSTLTVKVTDGSGAPFPDGTQVTFTAPLSGPTGTFLSANPVTTLGGLASVTFKAGNIAGTYHVLATAIGVGGNADFLLTNLAGAPTIVIASFGGFQSVPVNTQFPFALLATVRDSFGNGVPGVAVTFTAPGSGPSGTFPGPSLTAVVNTDATGAATAPAFTSNAITGSYAVTATAPPAANTASFNLTNAAGLILPAGVTVAAGDWASFPVSVGTAAPSSIFVTLSSSDTSKVTISPKTLLINAGATIATTIPKVTGVSFGTASITASAFGYASVSQNVHVTGQLNFYPSSASIIAGATRQLLLVVTAPAPLGGFTVNLSSSNPAAATVPLTIVIPANQTSVNVPVSGVAGGIATIHASILPDVPDTTALITVTGPLAITSTSPLPSGQTGVPYSYSLAATGGTGSYTWSLIAGTLPGLSLNPLTGQITGMPSMTVNNTPLIFQVQDAGAPPQVVSAPFSLTITSTPLVSITPVTGTPQATTVNTNFASLTVIVKDSLSNPVTGALVTFTAPGAGASATFPGGNTATTNGSGMASVAIKANTLAGSYVVAATTAGASGPASFSLSNTAGSAASISVVSGSGQSTAINNTFASPLVAAVKDSFGNGVVGATVAFTGPGSGASGTAGAPNPAISNSAGLATSGLVNANGIDGSYSMSASTGALAPALFALTNTLGIILPTGLRVNPGDWVPFPVSLATAPGSAVFITLTSSNDAVASVRPSTLLIQGGATTSTVVKLNGNSFGSAVITANAFGYAPASTAVQVAGMLSFLVDSTTVTALNQRNIVLTLSTPAPPGGLTVTLGSSNSGVATAAGTVTVPAGANGINVTIMGVSPGIATITAGAPNYAPGSVVVTVN